MKPFSDTDVALVQLWLEKPHVKTWFNDPEDWLAELRNRHGEFSFIHHFIASVDEPDDIKNPIGFCQYYDCTKSGEEWEGILLDGVYSIDYLLGEEQYLGQGAGRELVRLITDAVWNDTPAVRIVVEPDTGNAASRASLLTNGYVHDPDLDLFFKERPAGR